MAEPPPPSPARVAELEAEALVRRRQQDGRLARPGAAAPAAQDRGARTEPHPHGVPAGAARGEGTGPAAGTLPAPVACDHYEHDADYEGGPGRWRVFLNKQDIGVYCTSHIGDALDDFDVDVRLQALVPLEVI